MKRNIFLYAILMLGLLQTISAQEAIVVPSAPALAVTNAAPAESRGYLLGPGDMIKTQVLGEEQFNFTAAVDENGMIEVPFLEQPVVAMCKNEREMRVEVTKVLSKYLRTPQVSLQVTDRKSRPPVIVYGEVRQPQQVTLMRKARLLELISAAGGVTEDAGGMIQVFRQQAPICAEPELVAEWNEQLKNSAGTVLNMYSYSNLRMGSEEANPVVNPGDVIIVQKAAPVYFTGEVKAAQGVHIPEGGLSLVQAIAMVGGFNKEAKTKDIKIYRLKPDSKDRTMIAVNYDLIKKGQQKDVMLEPYDIVEVDKSKKSILQVALEIATGVGRTAVTGIGSSLPQRVLY